MNDALLPKLMAYLRAHHPRSVRGVEEARAVNPTRFEELAEMFLSWLAAAEGLGGIGSASDAFAQFTSDVNLAQARYEAAGFYEHKSFAALSADHYRRPETMTPYLWGVYLTNILWAHHLDISFFFKDRFLSRLEGAATLLELAPGHGGWGVWALSALGQARLQGYDISPASITIARAIARAAGVGDRAVYEERDILNLVQHAMPPVDATICCFLIEHLESPGELVEIIARSLRPKGFAFLAGGLTAAQVDHIYEFRAESELVRLCEDHGLRVLETRSVNPCRTLPKARFLPRSMGLIVQKRTADYH